MAAKKKARKAAKKRATPSIGGGAFEMSSVRKPDPDGPWKPGEGWAQSGGTGQGTWLKGRKPKPKPK